MQSHPVWVVGEALVDLFSTGPVVGGAPFNVARTLTALGTPVRFVSRIGADATGELLATNAERYGLSSGDLQRDPEHPSGEVHVHQHAGQHHFSIASDSAWDYLDGSSALRSLQGETPALVYFGTLAQRHLCSRQAVRTLLESTAALRYLDLNLREGPDNKALSETSMQLADWVKVNDEELDLVLQWFGTGRLADGALDKGPEVPQVAALMQRFSLTRLLVTRGAAGYMCFGADGRCHVRGQGIQVSNMVDTVGAGDGFSAMFLAASLRGLKLADALFLANAYAADVCTRVGPMPAAPDALLTWRQRLEQMVTVQPVALSN